MTFVSSLSAVIARCTSNENEGAFLVKDDRVLKGPLGRSLRSFARTAHSAHSLRSALLRYICFVRSLHARACSLTLLTFLVGQLKFLNMCSHCYRVSREQTRFWRSLKTRPYSVVTLSIAIIVTVTDISSSRDLISTNLDI